MAVDQRTLLLVHALAPPNGGGVGVVLHRLLSRLGLEGLRVEVVTDARQRALVEDGAPRALSGDYRYFRRVGGKLAGLPGMRSLADLVNLPLAVRAGIGAGAAGRNADTACVLSVVDGAFSPIAGAIAARRCGRPHVLMVFDPWQENAYGIVTRLLARAFERRIFRHAAAIVVYCDQAAAHYSRKHGVECDVIATPIDGLPDAPAAEPREDGRREVLTAGAVYWAQDDAVRRLLRAARRVEGVDVTMLGDVAAIRGRRLSPDRVEPPRAAADFVARLQEADVLFLGVGVRSRHPVVTRMMTPARLADYMATGRPMLIHAPAGSYAAEYARSEDFAEVVDDASDDALAEGLRRVLSDPERAAERATRARRLARDRHVAPVVARRFEEILERASRSA